MSSDDVEYIQSPCPYCNKKETHQHFMFADWVYEKYGPRLDGNKKREEKK